MMSEINPLEALLGATIDVEDDVYIKRLGAYFTVKALTGDTVNDLRQRCTYTTGKGVNRKTHVNEEELGQLLIAESCINPDFSDQKLLKHYGAVDKADCVQKALLAGEVALLSSTVLDVSGFDNSDDEVEEIKN